MLCFILFYEIIIIIVNSVQALKGNAGEDKEIMAPVGIVVTSDNGKTLGE